MFKDLRFSIGSSKQEIVIRRNVFRDICKYMQIDNSSESGGLLFAEFKLPEIIVKKISTPNKTDYRSRYEFKPDQAMLQKIINTNFDKGLHYIGEWHTHPEKHPVPSIIDIASIKDTFIASRHDLNYFLLVILGNKTSDNMFWIGL